MGCVNSKAKPSQDLHGQTDSKPVHPGAPYAPVITEATFSQDPAQSYQTLPVGQPGQAS